MRHSIYEQYATVREDTAAMFDSKLNETIYRLRHHNPKVVISESDPLCAYVKYSINEAQPETIAEEYQTKGIKFTCKHCPNFKPILKEDETVDKRCRYGDCDYADMGRTKKDAPACDLLYNILEECNVKIVFDEEV